MDQPLTPYAFQQIRTIAQADGRLHALRYIRTFHAENFLVAKMVPGDVLNNEAWTAPHIQADINNVRERIRLNAA